jgi:hypothetical protein
MRARVPITVVALVTAVLSVTAAPGEAATPPRPAFDHPVQNPYFPLVPGTVARYRGTDEGERFTERVTVTHRTRVIQGVATTVVRDVLRRSDGTLAERTHDWYAADDTGRVWYFGEATATYDARGRLESREGSWRAGAHGAVAGTIMPADPRPGDAYRQELWKGHAEDQAWIVQRGGRADVPYGHVRRVVRTLEWSRLEKGVVSEKLYAPGAGVVSERDLSGGSERFVLVSVTRR